MGNGENGLGRSQQVLTFCRCEESVVGRVTKVHESAVVGIVDDDESVRKSLKRIVISHHFTVEAFASAEEVLQSDHLPKLDCLILDVVLPGMSGLGLQDHLAAANRRIPIIFITAQDDEGVRGRALQAGARGFLLKPFSKADLFEILDQALKSRTAGKGELST